MDSGLNLDGFTAAAIRDVLKTKHHLLAAGWPANHSDIRGLDVVIRYYRAKVGLTTYLSQMLGELATRPIVECQLYWPNGERVPIEMQGHEEQPVQRFVARWFGWELPFRVVVEDGERYL